MKLSLAQRIRRCAAGVALTLAIAAPAVADHAASALARSGALAQPSPQHPRVVRSAGATAVLVVADKRNVPPTLLTAANLLALGKQLHNTIGSGKHHHVVALPVLLVGTRATPSVKVALATIKRLHPVRLYLLGMTHGQRLTLVINTLYDGVTVYINKSPGAMHNLSGLRVALRTAIHFVPIITKHGRGASLENAQQVAADTPITPPNLSTPPSVELAPSWLPAVGNQGNESSCVGWSTSYYYKTFQEAKEHQWNPSSLDHVFSPAFVYNQINNGVDRGSQIPDAMTLITQRGDAPWAMMPYQAGDFTSQPSQDALSGATPFRALDFGYLLNHSSGDAFPYNNDVTPLKQWLASGDGFVITMPVYHSFDSYTGGVYNPDGSEAITGYHAVFVVGYDDNAESTGIGAFRIVNSWGPGWGEGGHIWLSYDFFQYYVSNAWAMYDAPNDPLPNPNPNPPPTDTPGPNPQPQPTDTPAPNPQPQPQSLVYTAQGTYSLTPNPDNGDFMVNLTFTFQAVQDGQVIEQHVVPATVEQAPNDDQVYAENYTMGDGTEVQALVEVLTPDLPA